MKKALTSTTMAVLTLAPRVALAQPRPFGDISLQQLIGNVVRNLLGLMGIATLIIFAWGGFLWMTARGNDEQTVQAKRILLYSTLGVVISFSAYAILGFVLTTLQTVQQ